MVQKSLAQFMKQGKEGAGENPESGASGVPSENLKIWHWNVNGIRAVLNSGKFQEFVKKGKSVRETQGVHFCICENPLPLISDQRIVCLTRFPI